MAWFTKCPRLRHHVYAHSIPDDCSSPKPQATGAMDSEKAQGAERGGIGGQQKFCCYHRGYPIPELRMRFASEPHPFVFRFLPSSIYDMEPVIPGGFSRNFQWAGDGSPAGSDAISPNVTGSPHTLLLPVPTQAPTLAQGCGFHRQMLRR